MSTRYWKTAALYEESKDALTVVFDTGGQDFRYKAGQFIQLTLLVDGKPVTRAYSLASVPDGDERPAITVKRVPGGIMSEYILAHAEEITEWVVDGPYGQFHAATAADQPIILIGGGSGITPLYSMLKYMLKHSSQKLLLVYSNRHPAETIYLNALFYLEQVFSHRLKVWHFFSGKNEGEKKDAVVGGLKHVVNSRLSPLLLKKLVRGYAPDDFRQAAYFLCGPAGLTQMAEETLLAMGVGADKILREYFSAPAATSSTIDLPNEVQEVLFHFNEQTNLLEVKPGKTILEAALQDRIPVPYSCKSGTCGVCAGRVISGRVHMQQNYSLGTEALQNGWVLLCQSHPMDNSVTIEAAGQY